ncbi:MAG TPA: glycerophosphodiester phosphodiesterase family protein [Pseudolabrys sp.]|jgi:glycerophosphoryl diester phosphodiesterase|nr:glycerophosphodiester phosphodiesterase family protein [Pseudolabrys sp.]
MGKLDWLTEKPVAHRGLHDISAGIVENTASAFKAAIDNGYAIETDVQISADNEAMVHHDGTLGRLTEGSAKLASLSAAEIRAARFKVGNDRILTLPELCELVSGRAALVIELKSTFNGDTRIAARAVEVLKAYRGHAALMSFDPRQIETVRALAPDVTRGIVAECSYDDWDGLTDAQRRSFALFLHAPRSRPQFIAYSGADLPSPIPTIARKLFGLPVLTWTIRSEAERRRVLRYADQVIFEAFRPAEPERQNPAQKSGG